MRWQKYLSHVYKSQRQNLWFHSDLVLFYFTKVQTDWFVHSCSHLKGYPWNLQPALQVHWQNKYITIVFSKTDACSWLSRVAKCFWSSSLVFDGCRPEHKYRVKHYRQCKSHFTLVLHKLFIWQVLMRFSGISSYIPSSISTMPIDLWGAAI